MYKQLFAKVKLKLLILLYFFLLLHLYGQQNRFIIEKSDTFLISETNRYILKSNSIIPGSEKLFISNEELPKEFFLINYFDLSVSLSDKLKSKQKELIIRYEALSFFYKKNFYRYEIEKKNITSEIVSIKKNNEIKNIFLNSEIKKSGAITRGFNISSNKDFQMNSGFRLQLEGDLSSQIKISASLTDEKLPFQPEGNTERLEEIDKVFIRLYSSSYSATFGDFDYSFTQNKFTSMQRKLQGLNGNYTSENYSGEFVYGAPRGNYAVNKLSGQTGLQGSYRLSGKNGEREILIIAGTEKVFIDGIQVKRGEGNDYTIDYSQAELTFTPRRIITNTTRIVVEFQYTDLKFRRTFLSVAGSAKYFDKKLSLMINYSREGDDLNRPYEDITDEEKEIIKKAGNDYNSAFISGIRLANSEDKKGKYVKIDTLLNNQQYSIYRYNPGKDNAIYDISFSYVGENKGDYKKESFGRYKFIGIKSGDYMPIKKLNVPTMTQNLNFTLNYKQQELFQINLESAFSILNQNQFASLDNIYGNAQNFNISYSPENVKIFDLNIGNIGVKYNLKYVDKKFVTFDRINSAEYERDYNIFSDNNTIGEILNEIEFNHRIKEASDIIFRYGRLKKDNNFLSERFYVKNSVNIGFFTQNNTIDYSISENSYLNSKFYKQNGNVILQYENNKSGVEYTFESKKEWKKDLLTLNSYKFYEIKPFFSLLLLSNEIKAFYSVKKEFSPEKNTLENRINTHSIGTEIKNEKIKEFRYTLVVNQISEKDIKVNSNSDYLSVRTVINSSIWDNFINNSFYYETSNQKSSRYEKIFVKVPLGQGNYKYIGDVNNNGQADENEFVQTLYDGDFVQSLFPTNDLIPVTDVKFNLRNKLEFKNLLSKPETFLSKFISKISNDFLFRIEENSKLKDNNKIHFLYTDYFRNDTTTIRGFQIFQNDFYWNRFDNSFSVKLGFYEKKGLQNYSNGIEKTYNRIKSILISSSYNQNFQSTLEYKNINDYSVSNYQSVRNRNIFSDEITFFINNRLNEFLDIGFSVSLSKITDKFPQIYSIINQNKEIFHLTYSIPEKGKLKLEFERNEYVGGNSNYENILPFEMLKGNSVGKNYILRLNLDYKITDYIQTSVNYLGRKLEGDKILHSFQAEAKAYF